MTVFKAVMNLACKQKVVSSPLVEVHQGKKE